MTDSRLQRMRHGLACLAATLLLLVSSASAAEFTVTLDQFGHPALRDIGASVTLATSAEGSDFQWYHDGAPIVGANAPTLQLSNLTAAQTGNYWLTRTEGAQIERSNTVTLNVHDLPGSGVDPTFAVTRPWSQATSPSDVRFGADGAIYVWDERWIRFHADGSEDTTFVPTTPTRRFLGELPNGDRFYSTAPYRVRSDGSAAPLQLPTEFQSFLVQPAPEGPRFPVYPGREGTFFMSSASWSGPPASYNPIKVALLRFNADGSLDTTFVPELPDIPLIDEIADVQVDDAARVYVSVLEYVPRTPSDGTFVTNLVRLLPNGNRDPSFPVVRTEQADAYHLLGDGRLLRSSHTDGWQMLRPDGSIDPTWSTSLDWNFAAVDRARNRIYAIADGFVQVYAVGATGLERSGSYYNGAADIPWDIYVSPSGAPHVTGFFSQWGEHPTRGIARLREDEIGAALPLLIDAAELEPNHFRASTGGSDHYQIEWLALDGQTLPQPRVQGAQSHLSLPWTQASVGRIQPRLTSPAGTMLGQVFDLPYRSRPYLSALSGRAFVAGDEKVAIVGLGGANGPVLVRGGGPALSEHGVSGHLADPLITLFHASGAAGPSNDDWVSGAAIESFTARAGASPFAQNSRDSAMMLELDGAPKSVVLSGKGGSGVALVEAYLDPTQDVADGAGPLGLALRAHTSDGENTAIVGFVLHDHGATHKSRNIIVRAVGPSLAQHGVQQPLADPKLTLYRAPNSIVATNDDWQTRFIDDVHTLVRLTDRVGLSQLPEGSKDAAIAIALEPGIYTAHVTGGTGVVLLEIYAVP